MMHPTPSPRAKAQIQSAWYTRYVFPAILGYSIMATAISLALAIWARGTAYFPIDLSLTRRLQSIQAPWFDRLMGFICALGYPVPGTLLGALLMGLMYRVGLEWEALTTLFATGGSLLLMLSLILFANRPRPAPELVQVKHKMWTTSFPSGHALIFTSIVGFMCFLVHKSRLPALIRLPLLLILGSVVVLMGPARIYSGEHWPSDVLAAYLLGSTWLAAVIRFYDWGRPRYLARHPKAANLRG